VTCQRTHLNHHDIIPCTSSLPLDLLWPQGEVTTMPTTPHLPVSSHGSSSNEIPIAATKHPVGPGSGNGWTRKDRPCDACRRRKSRCIIPENTENCIMCHSRGEECTFVQTPQPRKRRRIDGGSEDGSKAKYVTRRKLNQYQILTDIPRSPEAERSKFYVRSFL